MLPAKKHVAKIILTILEILKLNHDTTYHWSLRLRGRGQFVVPNVCSFFSLDLDFFTSQMLNWVPQFAQNTYTYRYLLVQKIGIGKKLWRFLEQLLRYLQLELQVTARTDFQETRKKYQFLAIDSSPAKAGSVAFSDFESTVLSSPENIPQNTTRITTSLPLSTKIDGISPYNYTDAFSSTVAERRGVIVSLVAQNQILSRRTSTHRLIILIDSAALFYQIWGLTKTTPRTFTEIEKLWSEAERIDPNPLFVWHSRETNLGKQADRYTRYKAIELRFQAKKLVNHFARRHNLLPYVIPPQEKWAGVTFTFAEVSLKIYSPEKPILFFPNPNLPTKFLYLLFHIVRLRFLKILCVLPDLQVFRPWLPEDKFYLYYSKKNFKGPLKTTHFRMVIFKMPPLVRQGGLT